MLHRLSIALFALLLTTPAFATQRQHAVTEAPLAARTSAPARVSPPVTLRATPSERSRYAAREAASPEAKQYRGGDDVVIISASALAVVLAVVLLVILL